MEGAPFRVMHSRLVLQSPPVEQTFSEVHTEFWNSGPLARQSLVDSHCFVSVSTMKLQELTSTRSPEKASKMPAQRMLAVVTFKNPSRRS
jgi:hypothetical protein